MRTWAWLVVAVLAGCESKTGKPVPPKAADPALPAEAPENVADKELKRFLDGMLITSEARTPDEPTWPTGDDGSMLFWISYIAKQKFGIETTEELKAAFDKPVETRNRSDAWLFQFFWNAPGALQVWKRLHREDPDDIEAATSLGFYTGLLEGPKAGLEQIAKLDAKKLKVRDRRAVYTAAGFEVQRCWLAFDSGQFELARKYCSAAQELDEERGGLTLAKALLALGKRKEGLAQMEQAAKVPGAKGDAETWLWMGIAQQLNGQEKEAQASWNLASSWWPEYAPLGLARSGTRKSVAEWHLEETRIDDDKQATWNSYCGYVMAELGLKEQSEACYAAAERLQPGPALAHRLVFLSRTQLAEAHQRLAEAVKGEPHIHLMSAMAYVLFQEGKYPEARAWLEKVFAKKWNDAKATSLMWQVCGKQNDFVCVIEYRKRLGLPTHFNVEQYREVSRAWKEQAEKNGVGLAAREASSKDSAAPPKVKAISIVPLANRVPPELDGLDVFLTKQFPGLTITFAQREDLVGVVKPGDSYALWERVTERLREEPGALYVIEQDLGMLDGKYAFSRFDLEKGRGVASLSRLRSLTGQPLSARVTLDGEVLVAVQNRVKHLLANGVGKLAGLSFPCEEPTCPMHERRSVKDFSFAAGSLCQKHQAELAARVAPK